MSDIEHIPAISGAMDKRVRLLDSSVEFMAKLQARIQKSDVNLMSLPEAVDLLKVMSHQFTEVLEACRRCSADELVDRLDNLHLYQLIQQMTPHEKDEVRKLIMAMRTEQPTDVIEVSPDTESAEGHGQP